MSTWLTIVISAAVPLAFYLPDLVWILTPEPKPLTSAERQAMADAYTQGFNTGLRAGQG